MPDIGMKLTDEVIRSKRQITSWVAAQMVVFVTSVTYRDTLGHRYELLHEIVNKGGVDRIGEYRLVMQYTLNGNTLTTSYMFDLQMCLDLRNGWKEYVENRITKMMRELAERAMKDV